MRSIEQNEFFDKPAFPKAIQIFSNLNWVDDFFEQEDKNSSGIEDISFKNKLKAVFSVSNDGVIQSFVLTPSGLFFFFSNEFHTQEFLSFGLRHYYVITANLGTRDYLAQIAGIHQKEINGFALRRTRKEGIQTTGLEALAKSFFPEYADKLSKAIHYSLDLESKKSEMVVF